MTNSGYKLDEFYKYVQWHLFRQNTSLSPWKQHVQNGPESYHCGLVTLAADTYHVYPNIIAESFMYSTVHSTDG